MTGSEEEQQHGGIIDVDSEREATDLHSLVQSTEIVPITKSTQISKPTEKSHAVATRPQSSRQPIQDIMRIYGIPQLEDALKIFLIQSETKALLPTNTLHARLQNFSLPSGWLHLSVWSHCMIIMPLVGFEEGVPEKRSVLARLKTKGDPNPRFQTVLIDSEVDDPNPQDGLHGLRVAQVKLIFSSHLLTRREKGSADIPTSQSTGKVLAYVEWFSKPPNEAHQDMQMYAVSRLRSRDGRPRGGVVPLTSIVQPCYLLPRFKGRNATALDIRNSDGTVTQITGDNCLDLVDDFWINSFQDQLTYQTVF
ncbi:hypothetical protein M422DRAFT_274350 [Sphaerobolus stellatus SS14]|uniref:Uncharacterized protein n=1 Tax=Sphaerobolus stellatus (strain SS14) TaxID=990650 RepID=A0A0C9T746_SPHS4|nr:hypothetical protein M422DRAFT_274350 [Sphaerobolus stellatus SS14]